MFTKYRFLGIILLTIMMFLAVACGSSSPVVTPTGVTGQETPAASSHGGELAGISGFEDNLESAGAKVEAAGEVEQSFFPVGAKILKVNGADVQVFEFATEADRAAASNQISPDGSSVGTTMVTWVAKPHFWAHENLIILYVGDDPALVNLLTGVLGAPITNI